MVPPRTTLAVLRTECEVSPRGDIWTLVPQLMAPFRRLSLWWWLLVGLSLVSRLSAPEPLGRSSISRGEQEGSLYLQSQEVDTRWRTWVAGDRPQSFISWGDLTSAPIPSVSLYLSLSHYILVRQDPLYSPDWCGTHWDPSTTASWVLGSCLLFAPTNTGGCEERQLHTAATMGPSAAMPPPHCVQFNSHCY